MLPDSVQKLGSSVGNLVSCRTTVNSTGTESEWHTSHRMPPTFWGLKSCRWIMRQGSGRLFVPRQDLQNNSSR